MKKKSECDSVKIGRTIFIVERHFVSNRTLEEAVYDVVKNEVKRENKTEKPLRKSA